MASMDGGSSRKAEEDVRSSEPDSQKGANGSSLTGWSSSEES